MSFSPFAGSLCSLPPPCSHASNGIALFKPQPMKRKPKPSDGSIFKTSAIAPCTECGKQFNSWKALFGHMRCHLERPWRGMNMNLKPKLKPKTRVRQSSDWAHITDEVTRAALILMEMSGQSVGDIVDCVKRCCGEKVAVNKCIDLNSQLMEGEKEFAKLHVPLFDLNLLPPIEY